jgi:hypothetical protein
VFDFRESVDPSYEFNSQLNDIKSSLKYTAIEYIYRRLVYWGVMCGKLNDAKLYLNLSKSEAEKSKNTSYTTNNLDRILLEIVGE